MSGLPYFDLTGRVAVVSGGGAGIGRGISEGLAEAGASVVIGSRELDRCTAACREIREKTGVRTLALPLDVRDRRSIESFVAGTLEAMEHIDILVNNAGAIKEQPILDTTEEDWDLMLDTNLKGVFTLSRQVVGHMVARHSGGKIINVASIAGVRAWPQMAAYCASKGGCIQLTKVMALEWAKYDIQANAILPGYFLTSMNRELLESDEAASVIRKEIPMRRVAGIDEIKGLAVLLASGASSFMTGACVTIDGGQTCM